MSYKLWSATPTPLNDQYLTDIPSVSRMVEHHLRLKIDGIMLCGSCGEGAWITNRNRETLIKETVQAAQKRIQIAVQITDNSEYRMLEFAEECAKWGVDYAVVAQPYTITNKSPRRVFEILRDTIRQSPIPVGLYDRGTASPHPLEVEFISELAQEPNLVMLKDSSNNEAKRAAYIASRRKDMTLMSGNEFSISPYIQAGYDGLLLGGAIFNGAVAHRILHALAEGKTEEAKALQERMNELMWIVYGGKNISCWLSGLKYLLTRMQVFSGIHNTAHYALSEECKAAIDAIFDGNDTQGFLSDLLP